MVCSRSRTGVVVVGDLVDAGGSQERGIIDETPNGRAQLHQRPRTQDVFLDGGLNPPHRIGGKPEAGKATVPIIECASWQLGYRLEAARPAVPQRSREKLVQGEEPGERGGAASLIGRHDNTGGRRGALSILTRRRS